MASNANKRSMSSNKNIIPVWQALPCFSNFHRVSLCPSTYDFNVRFCVPPRQVLLRINFMQANVNCVINLPLQDYNMIFDLALDVSTQSTKERGHV